MKTNQQVFKLVNFISELQLQNEAKKAYYNCEYLSNLITEPVSSEVSIAVKQYFNNNLY